MRQSSINIEPSDIREALKGKKILFANMPADGHFNPLTGIAVYLKELGCDVRWYTSSIYADKITKMGIVHYPYQTAKDIPADKLEEFFPERAKHKNMVSRLNFDIIHFFVLRAPEFYEDIRKIYETFRFDILIAENAFTGIPFVKEKIKVPVISIGIAPLVETSRDLAPAGLGLTPDHSPLGKFKQAFLRLVARKIIFGKANRFMKRLYAQHHIDTGNVGIFDLMVQKSDLFLQSGTPGFEYHRSDLSPHIRFIGPLLPYSRKKASRYTNTKLDQYKKIIIVTQGTVERDVEKLLVPTLEAFKDTNYLVIATTGGSGTAALRQRFPQENFIIEDFIPFDDIMPLAQAYITNGGYGGVMLGIRHSLPLVVAGVYEAKNEICARVGYFKLGVNLKTEKPSPAVLRAAVEEVTRNGIYKNNIQQLGIEFDQYNPYVLCSAYTASLLYPQLVTQHHKPAGITKTLQAQFSEY